MLRPDASILSPSKDQYDDIVIEITAMPGGEQFIEPDLMDFYERDDVTPAELNRYYPMIQEAHAKFSFGMLFGQCLRGSVWASSDYLNDFGVDHDSLGRDLNNDFLYKYKYVIDWVWGFVSYYGVWSPLRFVGAVITNIVKHRSRRRD